MAGQSAGGGGAGTQGIEIPLQPGILLAATAFTQDGTVAPASTLVSLRIVSPGRTIDDTYRHLITGYITRDHPLSWQGLHSIRAEQVLLAFISSTALPVIQLQEVRLTTQNIGDLGRYLQSVAIPQ